MTPAWKMALLLLLECFLFSNLDSLTEAHSTHSPRMKFADQDTAVKRFPLPGHQAPVKILLTRQLDTVLAAGQRHLYSYNLQHPQKAPVEKVVLWKECIDSVPQKDCSFIMTLVHKRDMADQAFVCGTNGKETLCCDMNLSVQSPTCITSDKIRNIAESINTFVIKEGEPFALVESAESADLYITYSESLEYGGIHKFGKNRVGPVHRGKEQHYVGLMLSRRTGSSLQDRVYAFYKEKNTDTDLFSDKWLPFVTQVCVSDIGGPKSKLQSRWTSQMNARLFCGDPVRKQHFSELVDVATVHADNWQDTRVYALFRNEWGMSAVCVYTIQDIDRVFTTSLFKGSSEVNQEDRPRTCFQDSTDIPHNILKLIEKTSEMEEWVQPVNQSGPLLINSHNYTRIYADSSSHHTVLFLSLSIGMIHKVIQTNNKGLFIAEYHPFNHHDHILSIILQPSSRKLFVNSRSELVQLDVANCAKYGDSCQECILARDPYCSWNGTHCTPKTNGTHWQNVDTGNHTICPFQPEKAFRHSALTPVEDNVSSITLPDQAKYFLKCLMSSRHAHYTWHHLQNSTMCTSKDMCLFLIDNMSPEKEGTYRCVSEELGYQKVVAEYSLKLENRAVGQRSSPLVWLCLMTALIKGLS